MLSIAGSTALLWDIFISSGEFWPRESSTDRWPLSITISKFIVRDNEYMQWVLRTNNDDYNNVNNKHVNIKWLQGFMWED